MKITFLGTGTSQGVPIIGSTHPVCLSQNPKDKRLRSSILIEWEDQTQKHTYTIDCGSDFRQQMLRENVQQLDGVFFTHEHMDHIIGIDDLRPFCFRQGAVPLYAMQRVLDSIQYRFDYAFSTTVSSVPKLQLNTLNTNPITLGQNMTVTPIVVQHGTLPIYGYRWGKIAYLTYVKTIEEESIEKLQNLDLLIINALRIEEHPSHLSLEESLSYIEKIKPKKAYLTHISHLLGFHDEVEKTLPKNVHLAYDQLTLNV